MVKGLAKSEPLCFTVLPRTRESCSASTARSLLFQQLALTPVGAFFVVLHMETFKFQFSERLVFCGLGYNRRGNVCPAESVSQTGDRRNKLIFAHA